MSNLAFYATPIDFQKNDKLNHKLEESKKNKLDSDMLKQLTAPDEADIKNIHSSLEEDTLKEDNENTLADFYNSEMDQDLKKKLNEVKMKQDLYQNENINTDYLISNNLNMNKYQSSKPPHTQDELLTKLNYIIEMFEEQKDTKTNKKNEEIILYCFLGIFIIYVLDSFVTMGKYKRNI